MSCGRYRDPEARRQYLQDYRDRNRERLNKGRNEWRKRTGKDSKYYYHHHLKRLYGVSKEQYEGMLSKQGGCCAICKRPPKRYRLAVDHDHKTGKVRGLLCSPCNLVLHWFDTPELYEAILNYLR